VDWSGLVGGVIPGRLRALLGPRPGVLAAGTLLVVVLVGAFAYEFVGSEANSRRQAERSFAVQARITSELTSSLFTSSAADGQTQAAKAFGGRSPSREGLTALVKRSHLAYAVILGRDGRVLAASAGTPSAVLRRSAGESSHVRAAVAGRAWLSVLLPGSNGGGRVIEWALPFQTRYGTRIEVEAFDATVLSGFLRGYLKQSEGTLGQAGYVVDDNGRVIADSSGRSRLGDVLTGGVGRRGDGRFRSEGVERYLVSAPLAGSNWRVVLTAPTSKLYPALAGSASWVVYAVLAAFGFVGVVSLGLFRRTLIESARVFTANRQLAELNVTLEDRVAERTDRKSVV